MNFPRLIGVALLLLLAGCASAPLPLLPPTHPASPAAAESAAPPPALAGDEATQRTRELLKP